MKRQRRVLYICLGLIWLAVIGYVFLPWYLPAERIKKQIAEQIQRELKRPTAIGELRLSWKNGIEIRDVTIKQSEGFREGDLIRIGYIQTSFSPLDLMQSRLENLVIQDVHLYLSTNEQGEWNVRDLGKSGGGKMKIKKLQMDQIHVHLEDQSQPSAAEVFRISAGFVEYDEERDRMAWALQAYQGDAPNPALLSRGEMDLSVREKGQGRSSGRVYLEKLDLAHLPLAPLLNSLIGKHQSDQLTTGADWFGEIKGSCSSRMEFQHTETDEIQWQGNIELAGVGVTKPDKETLVENLNLRTDFQTRYNPTTVQLYIEQTAVKGSGLDLSLHGSFQRQTGLPPSVEAVLDQGRLEPSVLLQAIPWLEKQLPEKREEFDLAGEIQCTASVSTRGEESQGQIHLEGSGLRWQSEGYRKAAGEEVTVEAAVRLNHRTGELMLEPLRLQGDFLRAGGAGRIENIYELAALQANGVDAIPAADRIRILARQISVKGNLEIMESGRLQQSVPGFFRRFLPELELEGPVSGCWNFTGGSDSVFEGELSLPPETVCRWRDGGNGEDGFLFVKEAGWPFTLVCSGRFDGDRIISCQAVQIAAKVNDAILEFREGEWFYPLAEERPRLASLQGNWRMEGVENWLVVLPPVEGFLRERGAALSGNCQGTIFSEEDESRNFRADIGLQLAGLAVQVEDVRNSTAGDAAAVPRPPVFCKTRSEPAEVVFQVQGNEQTGRTEVNLEGWLGGLSVQGTLQTSRPGVGGGFDLVWLKQARLQIQARQMESLSGYFPAFIQSQEGLVLGPVRMTALEGESALDMQAECNPQGTRLTFTLAADLAGFTAHFSGAEAESSSATGWHKAPNTAGSVSGDLFLCHPENLMNYVLTHTPIWSEPVEVQIHKLRGQLSGSSVQGSGSLTAVPAEDGKTKIPQLSQADLSLQLHLNHNDELMGAIPLADRIRQRLGLEGTSDIECAFKQEPQTDRPEFRSRIDLTETGLHFDWPQVRQDQIPLEIIKPAGEKLRAEIRFLREKDGKLAVDQVFQVADNRIYCQGTLEAYSDFRPPAGSDGWPVRTADVTIRIDAPHLGQPARWISSLAKMGIEGRLEATVPVLLQFQPEFTSFLKPSYLNGNLSGEWNSEPVSISINQMEVSSSSLHLPSLDLKIGDNQITVVADLTEPILNVQALRDPSVRPAGRIDILSNNLDWDSLQRLLVTASPSGPTVGLPTERPEPLDLDQRLAILKRFDLQGNYTFSRLSYVDPKNQARMNLQALTGQYQMNQGVLRTEFSAGMSGGTINARIESDLRDPNAEIMQTVESLELTADDSLRPMVESEFPGMSVSGTISEKRQLRIPLAGLIDQSSDWSGTGTTICTRGTLYGPGGPGWMLKVFPGLELVEYQWQTMSNQYEMFGDGSKKNHMLFSGDTYDIYIDGISTPLRDANEYQEAIEKLEADLQAAEAQVKQLNLGEITMHPEKEQMMRRNTEGLRRLWQRHQEGERLKIAAADYIVGGIVTAGGGELFEKPKELLRVPIFRSRSYIAGYNMIGIETTNVSVREISRENLLYRLITGD